MKLISNNYLTRERRRFSALMMWSVEVGIQRRKNGQKPPPRLFFPVVVSSADILVLVNKRDRIVFIEQYKNY